MERIEFIIADGRKCEGYLLTWKGLSFGVTTNREASCKSWCVIELQTGFSVLTKGLPTKKEAIEKALELLNSKGLQIVNMKIKEILAERGDTKIKGKIVTMHCGSADDRLKTLCGRIRDQYCLPDRYFSYAKNPCKRCQRLAAKRKTG